MCNAIKVEDEDTKQSADVVTCKKCKNKVSLAGYQLKCKCGYKFDLEAKQEGFVQCEKCKQSIGMFKTPGLAASLDDARAVNMARNTSYVYLNGTRYLKYHKQAGCHEVLSPGGKDVFVPGHKLGFVEIDGIKLGLEICFDHVIQRLQKTLPEKPDLHVIVSAFVEPMASQVHVKPNGYVVSAASKGEYCKVYKFPGMIEQTTKAATFLNVDIYKIELDL
jgi:hypothetical protein